MSVNTEKSAAIIRAIAKAVLDNKQYLSDLDQAIGDGDHGFNMARGFEAVGVKLGAAPSATIGGALKTTAMALISTVGGASGPLYGSFFLKMASAIGEKTEIDLAAFAPAFKEGVLAVKARGKAEFGEKTMLDVLIPVAELLEKEAAAGKDGRSAFAGAAKLAEECMNNTKDKVATKGRAAYLGERSAGHIDPGATSSYLMIKTVAEALS
jgi:dihydroxyacetone kinase-like protein